jgi:pectate lyase
MPARLFSLILPVTLMVFLGCCGGGDSPSDSSAGATPAPTPSGTPARDFKLYGFANQAGGTTGGKGGSSVTVSSLAALTEAAGRTGPAIITVVGKLSAAARVSVTSNKTIVGSGSTAELDGIELDLRSARNVIVRNLSVHSVFASTADGDAVHLRDTQNVWIDHCDFYAGDPASQPDKDLYDGLVDIRDASAFITISWCKFSDHWKCSLVGSSDTDDYDRRTTYHHNYFRNLVSRLPSYRFGTGHVYNNYYVDVSSSGVNSRMGAVLRVEGNVFERVKNPIVSLDSATVGFWQVADNQFIDCTGSTTTSTGSFAPPYEYPLESSTVVKSQVLAYAGVGKVDPLQDLP